MHYENCEMRNEKQTHNDIMDIFNFAALPGVEHKHVGQA